MNIKIDSFFLHILNYQIVEIVHDTSSESFSLNY